MYTNNRAGSYEHYDNTEVLTNKYRTYGRGIHFIVVVQEKTLDCRVLGEETTVTPYLSVPLFAITVGISRTFVRKQVDLITFN